MWRGTAPTEGLAESSVCVRAEKARLRPERLLQKGARTCLPWRRRWANSILRWISERAGLVGADHHRDHWLCLEHRHVPRRAGAGHRERRPDRRDQALRMALLRKTWGEQLIGAGGIGLVFGLLFFVVADGRRRPDRRRQLFTIAPILGSSARRARDRRSASSASLAPRRAASTRRACTATPPRAIPARPSVPTRWPPPSAPSRAHRSIPRPARAHPSDAARPAKNFERRLPVAALSAELVAVRRGLARRRAPRPSASPTRTGSSCGPSCVTVARRLLPRRRPRQLRPADARRWASSSIATAGSTGSTRSTSTGSRPRRALRTDFNIPGINKHTIGAIKRKSLMKSRFLGAGLWPRRGARSARRRRSSSASSPRSATRSSPSPTSASARPRPTSSKPTKTLERYLADKPRGRLHRRGVRARRADHLRRPDRTRRRDRLRLDASPTRPA